MSLCFLSARVLPSFFHPGFSKRWSAACNISPSEIKFKKRTAGMSQKHSRHAGYTRLFEWNEWIHHKMKKPVFWACILSKITTLQRNANWFTLHIIIIFRSSRPLRVWTWKPLEEALAETVFVFRQMAADTPFYVAVMSSDVSCPLKME